MFKAARQGIERERRGAPKALKEKEEEHRREIKERERIMAVIKDHQNDVKEFNTDTKSL
jgi:hypothetical protein